MRERIPTETNVDNDQHVFKKGIETPQHTVTRMYESRGIKHAATIPTQQPEGEGYTVTTTVTMPIREPAA